MKDQRSRAPASVSNIYRLDGRVPVGKAIPFGLQHVLAMFVANVTPVMLIASVAVYNGQVFTAIDTALLIQAASSSSSASPSASYSRWSPPHACSSWPPSS